MFAEERYRAIVQAVNQNGKATVAELSELLGVTPVTVRRDLEKLEERGLLLRTHGGAMALTPEGAETAHERTFAEKAESYTAEKERIAQAAAGLVADEEAILLTPGTTNTFLFRKLAALGRKQLTVVTNAANLVTQGPVGPDLDIMLIGGKMRPKSFALVGPLAEQALSGIRVDKLFLGVDGFDLQHGLTTPNLSEASVNRKMIEIAKHVIVVADHSKFGRVFFSQIAPLEAVDTVITDSGIDEKTAGRLREMGVNLIVV